MKKYMNIHPGEILKEEYLTELKISAYALGMATGIPRANLSNIIHGKRGITADISIRLGKFFNQSPNFWLNIQSSYDMRKALNENKSLIDKIPSYNKFHKVI
ncbi:MAG: HigA family addiction module antitoxin [Spirochaetia bacterium]|nr:HigA family addiction module antitoxin [Spirochaetia bacterium]